MAYEIDFIGVPEEKAKKDADVIAFRWKTENGFKRCVYDAVFVSHSDKDHTSGLKIILENFKVKALYMNRPWLYADELYPKVNDGRKTVESLKRELKEKFVYIADLEEIALRKDIPVYEAFTGVKIESKLLILSPTKEQYKELLVASDKTPLQESRLDTKDSLISKIVKKYIM